MKYDKTITQIINRLEKIDDEECLALKKDLETLLEVCQKKDQRLHKIIKLSDKQQKAILELNEELHIYKTQLEDKVEEEIQKRKVQESLLFEQSRLAMIAEMIDAIAHQWKQPLNLIWLKIELLSHEIRKKGVIKEESFNDFKEHSSTQINHLIDTLNNFRDFFKPNQKKEYFSLLHSIESVLKLINDELVQHHIDIHLDTTQDMMIYGNENEFKHIFLNLISNSKYAFIHKNIQKRDITISIDSKSKTLIFQDNAGGIDPNILKNLFDKRTTTKDDEGTGMGLYMSQQIAKKHNGILSAYNTEDGAVFTFSLKDNYDNNQ